jgi:feruloyl esterase
VTGNELALATDNEGHIGASGFDALWAADDPAMRISYAYTSEHNLALAAKAIIAAYYGRGPSYSYFDGCSDGGREALVEAQRYPRDFNGILAGAPEIIASELNGEVQAWNILTNMDSAGHEIPHRGEAARAARGRGQGMRRPAGIRRRPAHLRLQPGLHPMPARPE